MADPAVETARFFKPFVLAMQAGLGNETAYLLIDCTQFQSSYLLPTTPDGAWQSTQALYQAAGLQPGQVLHRANVTFTHQHQFAGLHVTTQWAEGEDEVLCLVSTPLAGEQPHVIYEMRYWIETLFGSHKSRGFQLARTHMTTPEHIDRLVLVLAIATCLVLGLGTHLILIGETRQVDRADRRDLSLFRPVGAGFSDFWSRIGWRSSKWSSVGASNCPHRAFNRPVSGFP